MAALCAVTAIVSVVVPFAAGIALLGTVPAGLLAYRHRLRVLLTATIAAGLIAFLIAGGGGFMGVVQSAYIGGLTGFIKRKGRGTPTVVVTSFFAGVLFGAGNVGLLMVLTRLRHLMRDAITANVDGLASFLSRVHLEAVGAWLKVGYAFALRYWHVVLLGLVAIGVMVMSLVGWWALSRLLERMRGIPDVHKLDAPAGDLENAAVGPVPVRLNNVRFRYPGAGQDALREISMEIDAGEHVAITGANGSGKTTLMLILAGRQPTAGTVDRPGAVGLGKLGGTAVVLQHPESQVLGTRVADDVVWGLPPGTKTDVAKLLREVGLDDLAERETGSLSGGELQRLALAAALAREPAMLIADEVTTMVDQQGRDGLLSVLSGLTKRHRTALVHITHYNNEAESADRTIKLSDSPDNTGMVQAADAPAPAVGVGDVRQKTLELIDVGHEYGIGTPWAKTALHDINFVVEQGDGVLIHGGNGTGKSTLGWIMAGLTTPTSGQCLLDGRPTHEQVGAVALSFQAARLQLMRSRVDLEVASAAGFSHKDTDRVAAALGVVGLDPALATRSIDKLSGGQMRRVVLAGLLACKPRALILDEPLAGLDTDSQRGLLRLLEGLRRDSGLTVVVIAHDYLGMETLCPRILHLNNGTLESVSASTSAGGVS
nr:ABC transporter ATP-binding protein [Mycobacterium asiaticum]